jgi:hypothetical protein
MRWRTGRTEIARPLHSSLWAVESRLWLLDVQRLVQWDRAACFSKAVLHMEEGGVVGWWEVG